MFAEGRSIKALSSVKTLLGILILGLGFTSQALGLQVIEPEGDKGPFVLNFRFPHLFYAFYIDTPAEVSLDFEAGLRKGVEPIRLKGYLNDRYTFDFVLQKDQRYGRYRLYLGPVLRGRHSLRIDLVGGNDRKTPEAVLDRVRFLGSEPGDESFSVLRHTPLYIIQPMTSDVPLFGRFYARTTDFGIELLYGLVTSSASDPTRLNKALDTYGLPFAFLDTLRVSLSPFGIVRSLEIPQDSGWKPFEGGMSGFHPLLSLDADLKSLQASPSLPKEGVYRVDPTLYRSVLDGAFLDGLPWMVTLADRIAKDTGAFEGSHSLSSYLFFRFHADQAENRGPFGLEAEFKSGQRVSLGLKATPDPEGAFGFALRLAPPMNPSDIVRFRVVEGRGHRLASDVVLDRLFMVNTDKGVFSWQSPGQDWHRLPDGFFEAKPD